MKPKRKKRTEQEKDIREVCLAVGRISDELVQLDRVAQRVLWRIECKRDPNDKRTE